MKVLFVASEATPIVKVGGLGDVAGSLPIALNTLGLDIRIALPFYSDIHKKQKTLTIAPKGVLHIPLGNISHEVKIYSTALPHSSVPVYLFEHDYLSRTNHRAMYEGTRGLKRFMFFSRIIAAFLKDRANEWNPDIIHLNDWHTALIPVTMEQLRISSAPKTLLTIHNLPYQGLTPITLFKKMGFSGRTYDIISKKETLFTKKYISILREGIRRADYISTVSSQYAREIVTPEYSAGLGDVLAEKKDRLFGILNGIDYNYWNPQTDKYVYTPYSHIQGKAENKKRLAQELGLGTPEKPIVAFIGRLDAHQKGIDILLESLQQLLPSDAHRYIILGQGDKKWESMLRHFARAHKGKLAFVGNFDEPLAHKIYAGADMMVIPSKYEPCGLVQMIAMRYGTLPVARRTGGLIDSIRDREDGFLFEEYGGAKLREAIHEAASVYQQKNTWNTMVEKAMKKDFSWDASAKKYLELYEKMLNTINLWPEKNQKRA